MPCNNNYVWTFSAALLRVYKCCCLTVGPVSSIGFFVSNDWSCSRWCCRICQICRQLLFLKCGLLRCRVLTIRQNWWCLWNLSRCLAAMSVIMWSVDFCLFFWDAFSFAAHMWVAVDLRIWPNNLYFVGDEVYEWAVVKFVDLIFCTWSWRYVFCHLLIFEGKQYRLVCSTSSVTCVVLYMNGDYICTCLEICGQKLIYVKPIELLLSIDICCWAMWAPVVHLAPVLAALQLMWCAHD